MDYKIKCSYKKMNKVYFAISDKYGWENVPYVYNKSTMIEIPMWRYTVKFISSLLTENDIEISKLTKDDIIFLDSQ